MPTFTIPGQPSPKGRPRAGKHGNVYTPSGTREAEERVRAAARQAGIRKPLNGPVRVCAFFYGGRGDLDNLGKLVLDALNGIAYLDDKQVVDLLLFRREGRGKPETVVSVDLTFDH